jgi:hypothetical protein
MTEVCNSGRTGIVYSGENPKNRHTGCIDQGGPAYYENNCRKASPQLELWNE